MSRQCLRRPPGAPSAASDGAAGAVLRVFRVPYIAGTADEHQYWVMADREQWFCIVMGQDAVAELIPPDADGPLSPLPSSVGQSLTFDLSVSLPAGCAALSFSVVVRHAGHSATAALPLDQFSRTALPSTRNTQSSPSILRLGLGGSAGAAAHERATAFRQPARWVRIHTVNMLSSFSPCRPSAGTAPVPIFTASAVSASIRSAAFPRRIRKALP